MTKQTQVTLLRHPAVAYLITDLVMTTVSVRRDRRVHTVSCYGVEEFAEHYPRATDLNILKNTIAEVYSAVGES